MKESDKTLIANLRRIYQAHQEGEVMVTDKVSYIVKNVIRRARKNYLGVYDEPRDPITGEEKFWPPLTESVVDAILKEIDLDLKNIDLFPVNGSNPLAVRIYKAVMKQKLKEAGFSQALNNWAMHIVTDGSGYLKFIDDYDAKKKRRKMKFVVVDGLNIVADESVGSIHEASCLIERCLLTAGELKKMKGVWDSKAIDAVLSTKPQDLSRHDPLSVGPTNIEASVSYYPVYEFWGLLDKSDLTGKESDCGNTVEAHLVIANLTDGARTEILFRGENEFECGKRPYCEAKLKNVIGRRTGRGAPESLFGVQKYLNMVMDIRKKNAQILQNGLFKAKKSMGLEIDSILNRIAVGGIVPVDEQDDFMQMPINDYRESSYRDESALVSWGERNTGANDVIRGDQAAMSAPATNALIKDRNAKGLFQLVQENMGIALREMIEDFVLPWLAKNVKDGEIIDITGSPKDIEEIDNAIADYELNKAYLAYVEKNKVYPKPEEVMAERDRILAALRKRGAARSIELRKNILSTEVGVNVEITDEMFDRPIILGKLQELLTLAVTNPGVLNLDPQGIAETIFELLDLPMDRIYMSKTRPNTPMVQAGRDAAKNKMQAAQQSQALNSLTGKVAPQMNSSTNAPSYGPAGSGQGIPPQLDIEDED